MTLVDSENNMWIIQADIEKDSVAQTAKAFL